MLRTQFCLYKVGHGLPTSSDGFLSLPALSLSHRPLSLSIFESISQQWVQNDFHMHSIMGCYTQSAFWVYRHLRGPRPQSILLLESEILLFPQIMDPTSFTGYPFFVLCLFPPLNWKPDFPSSLFSMKNRQVLGISVSNQQLS